MFTVSEYLNKPFPDQTFEEQVGDETFLIRRLDGIDALRLDDIDKTDKRFIHILSNGLLDGKTRKPIGDTQAQKFIREYRTLAIAVAIRINNKSRELDKEESQILEEYLKNSETTDMPSSTGNTVSGSDSIPSEPNQAKEP